MQQHSPESSSRRECVQQRWEDSAERRDPAIPRRPGSLLRTQHSRVRSQPGAAGVGRSISPVRYARVVGGRA
jgi:hypothetical protein